MCYKKLIDTMDEKVKKYLKNLGLDINLYNGYFKTDYMIHAKIDKTIVLISYEFDRHQVIVYNK
tara:strand:+ start:774 stop:965 length:192 start_codon:yes stop_codon:yes gene_type:complete